MPFIKVPQQATDRHSSHLRMGKNLDLALSNSLTEEIQSWGNRRVSILWDKDSRLCRIEPGSDASGWLLSKYNPGCRFSIGMANFFSSSPADWKGVKIPFTFNKKPPYIEFKIPAELQVRDFQILPSHKKLRIMS